MKIDILNNDGRCDEYCPFLNGMSCLLFKEDLSIGYYKNPKWKYKTEEFPMACSECNYVLNKQKEINQYELGEI